MCGICFYVQAISLVNLCMFKKSGKYTDVNGNEFGKYIDFNGSLCGICVYVKENHYHKLVHVNEISAANLLLMNQSGRLIEYV